MGGSPGELSEELCSFSNLSVTSSTSQLILQPFRRFTYITAHSPTLPLLLLSHSSFPNPSFASPTSQVLHLIHLASRPWRRDSADEWSAQCFGHLRDNTIIKDDTHHSLTHLTRRIWLWWSNDIWGHSGPKATSPWGVFTISEKEKSHKDSSHFQSIQKSQALVPPQVLCEVSWNQFWHGRLARWIKWRACDVGEAKEGLEYELWRKWSNGRVGEWAVT